MSKLRETYRHEHRINHIAGALRIGALGDLLLMNGHDVPRTTVPTGSLEGFLFQEKKYHLEKTAQGWSIPEICRGWSHEEESDASLSTLFDQATDLRGDLLRMYNVATPAHLVTVASNLGHLACPPLELTSPYRIGGEDVAVVGLLSRGLQYTQASRALRITRGRNRIRAICPDLSSKLPEGEAAPPGASAAWLVHAALCLDIIPNTRSAAECLDVESLRRGITALMDPERPFLRPPIDSPIAIAAAPF